MTSKLVVVDFAKCHLSVFLWQVKSHSWIFVVIQMYPHQFVVVLEQFWCQVLQVAGFFLWNGVKPFAVHSEVIHVLQLLICFLLLMEIRLKGIETFCNFIDCFIAGSWRPGGHTHPKRQI